MGTCITEARVLQSTKVLSRLIRDSNHRCPPCSKRIDVSTNWRWIAVGSAPWMYGCVESTSIAKSLGHSHRYHMHAAYGSQLHCRLTCSSSCCHDHHCLTILPRTDEFEESSWSILVQKSSHVWVMIVFLVKVEKDFQLLSWACSTSWAYNGTVSLFLSIIISTGWWWWLVTKPIVTFHSFTFSWWRARLSLFCFPHDTTVWLMGW